MQESVLAFATGTRYRLLWFSSLTALCLILSPCFPGHAQEQDLQSSIEACKGLEDDDPGAAEQLAVDILAQANESNNAVVMIEAYGCMGWAQARQGKMAAARDNARQMEIAIQASELTPEQTMALGRRAGGVMHQAGDRIAAAEYYARALQVGIDHDLRAEQIPLLVNFAVLHSEFKEHERAIERYEQALGLMAELEDYRYQPPVLFNLALTLNGQGYHQRALNYLQQTEELINEHWPRVRTSQVYAATSGALLNLDRVDEALAYAERAIEDAEELGRSGALGSALVAKADALLSGGDALQALPLAVAAVDMGREAEDAYQLRGFLDTLQRAHAGLGNYAEALEVAGELRALDSEINQSANTERLAEMEAVLQDAKQREELMELKFQAQMQQMELTREREITRYAFIAGGILVALILGVVLWQRQMNHRLQLRSLTDTLTQLPNRRRLMQRLDRQATGDHPRILWLLDLDRFKQVNDRYGHETGDQLLREIGNLLGALNSPTRLVGRWGGEEFLAVTDDVSGEEIETFQAQLRAAVSTAQVEVLDGQLISVSTSVGYATVASDNYWEAALNDADSELYRNKRASLPTRRPATRDRPPAGPGDEPVTT